MTVGLAKSDTDAGQPQITVTRRRLRIVHIYDGDYPTPDVRTEKVSRALTDAGCEVHIVARNRTWGPTREQLPEGLVHRMRPLKSLGQRLDAALGFPAFVNPRWVSLLSATVRTVRPDVIIARDLPLCPTALWVGRRFGVPVVFDMAENYPAMMRDIWNVSRQSALDWFVRNPTAVAAVERYCLPRVDHVITVVEESARRVISAGVPETRVSVVRNTPFLSRLPTLSEKDRSPTRPLELIYLGLIEIPRGIDEVLEALAILRSEQRAVHCTFIGSGRDEQLLRHRANALGLQTEAKFVGFVPYRDALRLVARADVGIVPHRATEAWNTTIPNKLFDYMGAGLPVLTSDAAPAARIIREAGAGEVFRSRDSRDLAFAITRLFDSDVRATCAEAGRRAVFERYNWAHDSQRLLRAIEAATERGGRSAGAGSYGRLMWV
ncbi:MAG TPA: glycosyltransferase family 4 protein [Gemmatimonadaceae bacterium]|jgi:glycosyltransferase involved in cell wall biosynthesis